MNSYYLTEKVSKIFHSNSRRLYKDFRLESEVRLPPLEAETRVSMAWCKGDKLFVFR